MSSGGRYRVREVAATSGISVRTLHHYDEIGLLVPARTRAGYRIYTDADLLRLQQILIGRTLGLSLPQIQASLDNPHFDRRATLLAQKAQLEVQAQQTQQMLRAIETALALLDENRKGDIDMKQLFDGFDPAAYETETRERWGHTDSYKESARRTASYTQEDWQRQQQEQEEIYTAAFRALEAGLAPDSVEAMDIAERHRLAIDHWFYPCSHAHHALLADGYEADSRFAENIDKFGTGLTVYVSAAIRANSRRN